MFKTHLEQFRFTVFDFETTGFEPTAGAEIIEVGAVRLENGDVTDSFQQFVAPNGSIPTEVRELTGIEPDDLSDAPPVDEVLPEFLDFAGDSVLVAHNTEFDMKFLRYYSDGDIKHDTVDTLRICRKLGGFTSNKLDDLTARLDISREETHRAHEDARATAELLLHLASKISDPDDYKRSGIPETIAGEDPAMVLSEIPGLSKSSVGSITDEFDRVSEMLDVLREPELELPGVSELERNRLKEFFDGWHKRENIWTYLKKHGKGPSVLDSFDPASWTWSNWTLNGMGFLFLGTAVFVTRSPETFWFFVVWSVPCFVGSSLVLHFRNRPYERVKKIVAVALIFLLTGLYLYGT